MTHPHPLHALHADDRDESPDSIRDLAIATHPAFTSTDELARHACGQPSARTAVDLLTYAADRLGKALSDPAGLGSRFPGDRFVFLRDCKDNCEKAATKVPALFSRVKQAEVERLRENLEELNRNPANGSFERIGRAYAQFKRAEAEAAEARTEAEQAEETALSNARERAEEGIRHGFRFVNVYRLTLEDGGPEEGGWHWTRCEPVACFPVGPQDDETAILESAKAYGRTLGLTFDGDTVDPDDPELPARKARGYRSAAPEVDASARVETTPFADLTLDRPQYC